MTPSEDDLLKGLGNSHSYFSPQKLQIVKPMEGSVTLLRWKLLATPQLRGTSGFLESEAEKQTGIHLKNYSSNSRPGTPKEKTGERDGTPRKWHSVYNLSSEQKQEPSLPLQKIIHRRHQPSPRGGGGGASQLSTVGKVKQNIMGFLSPGSTQNKKSPPTDRGSVNDSSAGLQELLGF